MAIANRGIVLRQIERLYQEGTLAGLGDGPLLERYVTRGDQAAFEALVDLHGPMVLGLCRRMLHDPRDVEDAFQATFLILVRKASAIRDRTLLSNWLYGVAYRVAVRARTNAIRRKGRETGAANLEVAAAPEAIDHQGIGPVLDQELNRLPEKYRAPLVLCYLRSRTHGQAAEELRCPVGTVRSRLARGRDLLRDRLTRRGYAPTAAILGPGTSLPGQVITMSVPRPLLASTIRTALGYSSLKVFPAGAASVTALALSQGVLTTMKLAQLKWIGLAALATSLSTGGAVAVSYVNAQNPRGSADSSPAAAITNDPTQDPASRPKTTAPPIEPAAESTDDRLKALENKLDQLLNRSGASTAPAAIDPFRAGASKSRSDLDLRRSRGALSRSIPELEVELKMAVDEFVASERLYKRQGISSAELEKYRDKVLIQAYRAEGLDEEFADELARLKLEMRRKVAELDRDNAMSKVAATVVARNTRLNERKPGMVSSEDVAKAEAELKVAEAAIAIKQVEIEEVSLQLRQLERGSERVGRLTELVKDAKAQVNRH